MTQSDGAKLRVLLVIESSGGGSARHVVDLAGGLLAKGHQVEVAYSQLRADSWFMSELGALERVVVHPLKMHRSLGIHDLASALKLRSLIAKRGPFHIIHGHSAKAGALIRLAGIGTTAKKVYTPHAFITLDPTLRGKKRWLYTLVERLLARLGDGIICVSNEEQEHAKQLGIADKLLFTVENGLGQLAAGDRKSARKLLDLREDNICIGFVGRLSSQKPVGRLVRAFHLLHLQFPGLIVAIVGDGPDYERLRGLAHSLNIEEKVRFTGSADGSLMMSGFDVFVLPSSYEAFPYVYLEALSRALPIITTDVGGSSAVVDEGVNGYVVPQSNLDLLVGRIAALVENPELLKTMGHNSLNKAQDFTITHMVDKTIEIYQQLHSG